jgi:N-acetylglucosaminyldiphosphoundecaprenol N-acetyl-beta-D-mannosaminyltransferase
VAGFEDHAAHGDRDIRAGERLLSEAALAARPRLDVLGVGVDAVDLAAALARIETWIDRRSTEYVTVTGVHGVMESTRNEAVRRAHNRAGLVVPDGMPLVWLLKLAGYGMVGRVYGPDLMLALLARSETAGYRHYLYGATQSTLQLLEAKLEQRWPRARIVGRYAPPFRPAGAIEEDAAIAAINGSGADILWVGLSTPKQELWMANHRARIAAPVLIGVGAAFDFHSGQLRQAPGVLQRAGLEWAFRMAMEPRRLAGRYLRNNPVFLALLLAQRLHLRDFPPVEARPGTGH